MPKNISQMLNKLNNVEKTKCACGCEFKSPQAIHALFKATPPYTIKIRDSTKPNSLTKTPQNN